MNDYSSQDWSALHLAVDEDIDGALQTNEPVSLETAKALIEAGADEAAQDVEGRTPRDVAAAYGEDALRLYDAVSRLDWSGEPTLQEFTNTCRDILALAGYDSLLLPGWHQMSVARDVTGHSKLFGRVLISTGELYGWRRDVNFAERLIEVVQHEISRVERMSRSVS